MSEGAGCGESRTSGSEERGEVVTSPSTLPQIWDQMALKGIQLKGFTSIE